MSATGRTAVCYRADGSMKWATLLPEGTKLPPTTLDEGDTLWPYIAFGREEDGRSFKVPIFGPVKGPAVVSTDSLGQAVIGLDG